jgi:hypothetical protein
MSRLLLSFSIDLAYLKNSVFGCRDEVVYNNLLSSELFKELDEEFSFKKALYGIIFNYVPFEKRIVKPSKFFGLIKSEDGRGLTGDWNDFGFALLIICNYFGNSLSKIELQSSHIGGLKSINDLLDKYGSKANLTRMIESKQVFDTPFENADIYTNYFNRVEISELIPFVSKIEHEISIEDLPLFLLLKETINRCNNNLDLVVFSYEL